MKGIHIMKKLWTFKMFAIISVVILILHMIPFLFMGIWYGMILYYITYPFSMLFENTMYAELFSSVLLSTCFWTLIVMSIISFVRLLMNHYNKR